MMSHHSAEYRKTMQDSNHMYIQVNGLHINFVHKPLVILPPLLFLILEEIHIRIT